MTESNQSAIAAEQKPFEPKVGDRVRVVTRHDSDSMKDWCAPGSTFVVHKVRAPVTRSVADAGYMVFFIDASRSGAFLIVEPAQEKRPPCDACGAESVAKCRTDLDTHLGKCFRGEDVHLCRAHHSEVPSDDVEQLIRARRAALAEKKAPQSGDYVSGIIAGQQTEAWRLFGVLDDDGTTLPRLISATRNGAHYAKCTYVRKETLRHETPPARSGSVDAATREDAVGSTQNEAGGPCANSTQPTEPGRSYRPYARDRGEPHPLAMSKLDDRIRQAKEQLDAPLPTRRGTVLVGSARDWTGRKVPDTHPSWWPEDSGEELGHS